VIIGTVDARAAGAAPSGGLPRGRFF